MGGVLLMLCVSWWTVAAAQIPVLQVSPTSMAVAIESPADPSPQQVRIRNLGSGALRWTATSTVSWLRVSPRAGSGPAVLMVEIDRMSLSQGRHEGRVVVDAGDADDSPVSITVTVDVASSAVHRTPKPAAPAAGAKGATIAPTPAAPPVSEAAPSPGVGAAPLASGTGVEPLRIDRKTMPPAIRNLAYTQAIPIVGGTPPFTFRIIEGRLPRGMVLAQGSISGVARVQGNYPFVLSVTDASTPPVTIVATLAIRVIILQPDTALLVNPPSVRLRLPGRGRDGHATLGIASGRQVMEWTASTDVPWLRVVPASGSSPITAEIIALAGQLTPGTHLGTVTVTMEGAPNSPASIPVQVTVPR